MIGVESEVWVRSVGWGIALAIVLLVGGVGWLTRGRRPVVVPLSPERPVPSGVEMHLGTVRIHGVSGGKIDWEMEAENIDLLKSQPTMRVQGLKRAVMLNGTKVELSLTADTLERNNSTGDIRLLGAVTVHGPQLVLRTPLVTWDARHEELQFPQTFTARAGEFTVIANKATYEVTAGRLRCDGQVKLDIQGNTLAAGSALLNLPNQSYTLADTVRADLDVTDVQAWVGGQSLPAIPPIPDKVKARYLAYCRKHGERLPGPPQKGIRP